MKLYDLIREKIPEPKAAISDSEMVVLNRRDFIYSETSATHEFLRMYNAEKVSYEMHAIIDFLHSCVCNIDSSETVIVQQLSRSMTLPALAISVFLQKREENLKIFSPRGVEKIYPRDELARELALSWEQKIISMIPERILRPVNIFLCNASNEAEITSGIKLFSKTKKGMILIKGYGRYNAPNCGELMLSERLNIHCHLAGFGVSFSM